MTKFIHRSAVCTCALAFVLLTEASASAQKLYYDASEGGIVDKKNNLVWGYDAAYIQTAVPPGASGNGFPTVDPRDFATAESWAADYPAFLANYGWYDYANVAAFWENQGLLWRLPTLKEIQRAVKQGLFQQYTYNLDGTVDWFLWTSTATVSGDQYVIYSDGMVGVEAPAIPDGLPIFVRPYR